MEQVALQAQTQRGALLDLTNQRVGAGLDSKAELRAAESNLEQSAVDIEQARLITLRAADKMDREGNKAARDLIAAAKIVVPDMAARVIDRAMQVHGAAGFSQDFFLAEAYAYARYMRMGDGPDQVHLAALGKALLKRHGSATAVGHG